MNGIVAEVFYTFATVSFWFWCKKSIKLGYADTITLKGV